jgi:hypothetical protein
LAEEILSKIDNEAVRIETTALVYNPLVKKANSESDWSRAREYASKIREPLARTMALVSTADAMSKSKQDKETVAGVYDEASAQLAKEFATERVVKAYLLVARPLFTSDKQRALDAVTSAIYTLNKLAIKDDPVEESPAGPSARAWVRFTDPSLSEDEILNLPDLCAATFQDLARRDSEEALGIAESFRNEGLYSLAQLAVARVLFEEAKTPDSKHRKPSK